MAGTPFPVLGEHHEIQGLVARAGHVAEHHAEVPAAQIETGVRQPGDGEDTVTPIRWDRLRSEAIRAPCRYAQLLLFTPVVHC